MGFLRDQIRFGGSIDAVATRSQFEASGAKRQAQKKPSSAFVMLDWKEVTFQIFNGGTITVYCYVKDRDEAIGFLYSNVVGLNGQGPKLKKLGEQTGDVHLRSRLDDAVDRSSPSFPQVPTTLNSHNTETRVDRMFKIEGDYQPSLVRNVNGDIVHGNKIGKLIVQPGNDSLSILTQLREARAAREKSDYYSRLNRKLVMEECSMEGHQPSELGRRLCYRCGTDLWPNEDPKEPSE